ncbi:hypothetical protein RQP46_010095 [Phenoliferia psychrophenolica]
MHFTGGQDRDEMTAPLEYSNEAHFLQRDRPQQWVPYPSPSYHPLQLPPLGSSSFPPHPMPAHLGLDSYPPLPIHTHQRPVPPLLPRPPTYTPTPNPSQKAPTSTLRHPKSYYAQFRGLPTLRRDSGASAAAAKAKKKGGKVHRRRKTLSCEPCRRKKIRCDRNLECGPCELRGIECVWAENSAPNVPRDLRIQTTSNPQDVQTIDHLRNLIRQLGGQLSMEPQAIETLIEDQPLAPPSRPPSAPRRALDSPGSESDTGDDVLVWPSPISARRDSSSEGARSHAEPASAPTTPPTSNPSDTPGAPFMVLDALDHMAGGGAPFLGEFEWSPGAGGAAQVEAWRWGAGTQAGPGRV